MGSKRTIITLSEEDKTWLSSYSKAFNISVAEVIRQGVRRLRESEKTEGYRKLVEDTSGIWNKGDGLKFQSHIRSEWKSR
jgi:Arc/MetJ-type ribon-helix-helix transcriptional regulator